MMSEKTKKINWGLNIAIVAFVVSVFSICTLLDAFNHDCKKERN